MRTILHFLSIVCWENLQADSNFEVFLKTVRWLPRMHHYVLVPWRVNHEVTEAMGDASYTLLPYEYPRNVLRARHEFRSDEFARVVNLRKMDVDFVFCHQPELLGNLLAAFSAKSVSALVSFVFFHWIDCPASRGSACNVPVAYRQREAATLASRFFVHSPRALQYLGDVPVEKASYMPLSAADLRSVESQEPESVPKRPYVVFNHRRAHSTGWKQLESWMPPELDIVYTRAYNRAEYRWLLEHAQCAVCMISSYCTWNMAVQDPLNLGVPLVCRRHPVLKEMLKGSTLVTWVDEKKEFQEAVRHPLPHQQEPRLYGFDVDFRDNLVRNVGAFVSQTHRGGSKYTERWKTEIRKTPGISKAELIKRVHGKTASAHASWQYIRRELLREGFESRIIRGETVWYIIEPTNTNTTP